jgi:hypothetical protein
MEARELISQVKGLLPLERVFVWAAAITIDNCSMNTNIRKKNFIETVSFKFPPQYLKRLLEDYQQQPVSQAHSCTAWLLFSIQGTYFGCQDCPEAPLQIFFKTRFPTNLMFRKHRRNPIPLQLVFHTTTTGKLSFIR